MRQRGKLWMVIVPKWGGALESCALGMTDAGDGTGERLYGCGTMAIFRRRKDAREEAVKFGAVAKVVPVSVSLLPGRDGAK